MEISRHLLYISETTGSTFLHKLIVLLYMYTISGFICSGSICSDRTSGLVYSESNRIVTHISLSLLFRTYVSFIISGYSYYVNMLVTRL